MKIHKLLYTLLMVVCIGSFFVYASPDTEECMMCHGSDDIVNMSREERAEMVVAVDSTKDGLTGKKQLAVDELYVHSEDYNNSVHAGFDCVDCHADIDDVPHKSVLKAVNCGDCHSDIEEEYMTSLHAKALKDGDPEAPLCQDCHGNHYIRPASDKESIMQHRNIVHMCEKCHADEDLVERRGISIPGAVKGYTESVHGMASADGSSMAATCTDCHGIHSLYSSDNPKSKVYKKNIPETCAECHFGIYETFEKSVHGKALKKGIMDSPSCTDCHGEHYILGPDDEHSMVYASTISKITCSQCHAAEKLARKYGLASESIKSYSDSFHGLADQMGDTTVANCSSCHGYHDTLPSSDPASSIHPDNLPDTCGKCHPGAGENFAKGSIHGEVDADSLPGMIKKYTKIFYILIIILTIGGMLAHNILDFVRKTIINYRRKRAEMVYLRLTLSERISHFVLLTTFGTLVITGFALKFGWYIPGLSGEFNNFLRGTMHRIAAVLNTLFCIYHVGYVIFTKRGRFLAMEMIPKWKDVLDVIQMMKFYFGMGEKPKCDHFNYIEKSEYLALAWGTVVMVVTGLILWFEEIALKFIPYWGFDLANIIHYYEAVLATLAVLVWHIYYVILNPDNAPMSMAWISGHITEHEMEEEHPVYLERLTKEEENRDKD